MYEKKLIIPAVLIIIVVFSGCFSSWRPDEALITIDLGGESNRALFSDETLSKFDHTIVLTGSSEITLKSSGAGTVTAAVEPGNWNVAVSAYLEGEMFATGSADVDVSAGQNNTVAITMNVVPEQMPVSYRWYHIESESTATVDHFSVNEEGVCKVTIGGKAMVGDAPPWDSWRVRIAYLYTAKPNTAYAYELEAWTDDKRTLMIQYYDDDAENIYRHAKDIELTSTPTKYEFAGEITKGGIRPLYFQAASQLGTFYVKVLSITEYTPKLEYELINEEGNDNNGTYRLISGVGMSGALEIPALYNSKSVTEIGINAFKDASISSVHIPASITVIDGGAFSNCSSLTSITFAANSKLNYINYYAFAYCRKLTSLSLPESVIFIGNSAFAWCDSLTRVSFAADNIDITDNAFPPDDSDALKSAYFKDGAGTYTRAGDVWTKQSDETSGLNVGDDL